MAVIISEFEVVAPPAPREQPGREQLATNQQAQPVNLPRPQDVELIMHRLMQRRLRLWAD